MLKKPIVRLKTKRNLKNRELQPAIDFKSSKKIGIIYSDQFESEATLEKLIGELKLEGKETRVLVFCHRSKNIKTSLPYFVAKDISMSGGVQNEHLEDFLKEEYDFALCLDDSHHFLIDYVFSLLNAKCRVGFMQPARNNLFEMMVHADNSESVSSEVLRYLKMIQNV